MKKIVVILGHTDPESFCNGLAETYVASARDAGHEVQLFRLGEIEFDPVLRHGYRERQALEPGLQAIQDAIQWSDHLVLVYPLWWGSVPAILKGMFDRILLPGFAFKYRKNSQLWDRLLAGRTAHVITTMDTPRWYYRLVYCQPGDYQIKKMILEFTGIKPLKLLSFAPVRYASEQQRGKWLGQVTRLARSL